MMCMAYRMTYHNSLSKNYELRQANIVIVHTNILEAYGCVLFWGFIDGSSEYNVVGLL